MTTTKTGECSTFERQLFFCSRGAALGTREPVTTGVLTIDLPLAMYSDPGAPEIIPGEEARSRFYEAYRRQSNRFDKELKEYNKELNITLLFVRLVTIHSSPDGAPLVTEIKIIRLFSPRCSPWLLPPS